MRKYLALQVLRFSITGKSLEQRAAGGRAGGRKEGRKRSEMIYYIHGVIAGDKVLEEFELFTVECCGEVRVWPCPRSRLRLTKRSIDVIRHT